MGAVSNRADDMSGKTTDSELFTAAELTEFKALRAKFDADRSSLNEDEMNKLKDYTTKLRNHRQEIERRKEEAEREKQEAERQKQVNEQTARDYTQQQLQIEQALADIERLNSSNAPPNEFERNISNSAGSYEPRIGTTFLTSNSSSVKQYTHQEAEERLNEIQEYLIRFTTKPQLNLKFDLQDGNWREWSEKVREGLDYFELTDFITGQFPPSIHSDSIYIRYNRLTVAMIRAHLSPTIRRYVGDEPNATQLYRSLQIRGEGNKINQMVSVVNDWYSAVQHFQTMDHLINALRELIRMFNQIKSAKDPDALWCAFFLAALPNEFAHLRTTLSSQSNPSLETFFSLAIQEWTFRKEKDPKKPSLVHNLNRKPFKSNNPSGPTVGKPAKVNKCDLCSEAHSLEDCPMLKKLTGLLKPKSNGNNQNGPGAGGSGQSSSNGDRTGGQNQNNSNSNSSGNRRRKFNRSNRNSNQNPPSNNGALHNLNFDQPLSNGQNRTLNAGGILNDSFLNGDEPVLHPATQFLGFHIRANHHLIKPLDDETPLSKQSPLDVQPPKIEQTDLNTNESTTVRVPDKQQVPPKPKVPKPKVTFSFADDAAIRKALSTDPNSTSSPVVGADSQIALPAEVKPATAPAKVDDRQRELIDRYLYSVSNGELDEMIDNFQKKSKVCTVRLRPEELQGFIMDSGANDHFIQLKALCYAFKPMRGSKGLTTADGTDVAIDGIGHVKLKSTLGPILKLKNCVVCSKLKGNFVSAAKLDEEDGMFVLLGDRKVRIIYECKIIMVGELTENRLYRLHTIDDVPASSLFSIRVLTNEEKQLAKHRALGHHNFEGMRRIADRLKIKINPNVDCYTCVKGKMKALPFPNSSIKSVRPLELVHMDLSGTIRIPNPENYKYFLLLVDDYSRYKVVALLKRKTEVFAAVKAFKERFERQLEVSLKVFRSDNGTEFSNHQFDELCDETGIVQQFTCVNTPQQNIVAERGIGLVKQMARTLLLDANLGASFYPYAVAHAVKILNLLPCASIGFRIPYELFHRKQASYDDLEIFGSPVVYRVENPPNTFAPPGGDGIYLGEPPNVKGVYVYDYKLRKVLICRNVIFLNIDKFAPPNRIEFDDRNTIDLTSQPLWEDEEQEFVCKLRSADQGGNPPPPVLPAEVGQTAEPAPTEKDVRHFIDQQPPSEYQLADLGQDKDGLIRLNRKQRAAFERKHPHVNLRFVRGTNTKGRGRVSVYRVNHITAPKSLRQAMSSDKQAEWKAATDEEMASFHANQTGELVPKPPGAKVLPVMWVFAVKQGASGEIERYKARIVAMGNLQKPGRDFNESYAPVVNELTLRVLFSLCVQYGLDLHQIDIKTAFLNSELEEGEEVYIAQPPGYVVPGKEDYVYRLNRAIYGLRQSAARWYEHLSKIMESIGLRRSKSDRCLFFGNIDGQLVIVACYVDDCLIGGTSLKAVQKVKKKIAEAVQITDKGPVHHFLNLDIDYDCKSKSLFISQSHYIKQLLRDTGMEECAGAKTPIVPGQDAFTADGELFEDVAWYQMVMGRLIYLATHSRPDICFVVSRLCAFMQCPTKQHVEMVKRVIRYLKHTINRRLAFRSNEINVNIYTDADFANDTNTSRSVTGVASFVYGNLVNWYSRKQSRVANSTCQAEVLSIMAATLEAEYIYHLLAELELGRVEQVTVLNDNNSARHTIMEGGDFSKNKHYRTTIHAIKEVIQLGWMKLVYCPTDDMVADFLTKPLTEVRLNRLVETAGLSLNSISYFA